MLKTDIVPDLKKKIDSELKDLIKNDKVLSSCFEKIARKEAGWIDADVYAQKIGSLTSDVLLRNITPEVLPNGTMYYNIGNRLITPTLESDHQMISDYCVQMQESLNEQAHLGIKGQSVPFNQDRAKGIVDRLSSQPFEEVKWLLKGPIMQYCDSVRADHLEANVEFHAKSGLSPKIVRKTDGKCCKWCSERAGVYDYSPDMNREVFRKHENCGCSVEYDPADGSKKRQDVWTKKWGGDGRSERSETGKQIQKQTAKKKHDEVNKHKKESDLDNQTIIQIEKSIRSLKKQIEKHKEKINTPELIYPNWNSYTEIEKEGFKKHWNKEISNFEKQIKRRKREIEKRRSAYGEYNSRIN